MKPLSEETILLLHQLYQTPGLLDRFLTRREPPSLLLEKIAASGEIWAVSYLLAYVVKKEGENALAAAKVIDALLNQATVIDLATLDEHLRLYQDYDPPSSRWGKVLPEDIANLNGLGIYQGSVLGVSSFHSSGWVREKAVTELGNLWTGKELPFLIIRLNDWVPEVQKAAEEAVQARLQPGYAVHFIDCLPLVLRLNKRKRVSETSLEVSIKNLLQTEPARAALHYGLHSPDRSTRRACFRIALDTVSPDTAEVIQQGSQESDNQIRLWSVQKVKEIDDPGRVDALLKTFRSDGYMPVRREALHEMIKHFPERAVDELQEALLDPHASIRYEARFHLAQQKDVDFAALYREALQQERTVFAAVSGLGEVGQVSDDPLILPYISHRFARVRRAAVRALGKLNPKAHFGLFTRLLSDPAAGVSQEATAILKSNRQGIHPQRLWEMLEAASQPYAQARILSLFAHLPKWESLFYLLKAASSANPSISRLAYQEIGEWRSHFNRTFTYPTPMQKANILQLLEANRDILNVGVRHNIEWIIKSM